MSVLLSERPLVVSPTLAQNVGLNGAVMLQELQNILGSDSPQVRTIEGKSVVVISPRELSREVTPWWDERACKRILRNLIKREAITQIDLSSDGNNGRVGLSICVDNPFLSFAEKPKNAKFRIVSRRCAVYIHIKKREEPMSLFSNTPFHSVLENKSTGSIELDNNEICLPVLAVSEGGENSQLSLGIPLPEGDTPPIVPPSKKRSKKNHNPIELMSDGRRPPTNPYYPVYEKLAELNPGLAFNTGTCLAAIKRMMSGHTPKGGKGVTVEPVTAEDIIAFGEAMMKDNFWSLNMTPAAMMTRIHSWITAGRPAEYHNGRNGHGKSNKADREWANRIQLPA